MYMYKMLPRKAPKLRNVMMKKMFCVCVMCSVLVLTTHYLFYTVLARRKLALKDKNLEGWNLVLQTSGLHRFLKEKQIFNTVSQ